MTYQPVLAPVVLIAIAIGLILVRMVGLYRALVRTGTGHYRTMVLRWGGLTLAVLALVFAATRPGFDLDDGEPPDQRPKAVALDPDLNVFFVVDRSVDSRVEDYGDRESRMAGIRADMEALVNEFPRARFALISFAAKASLEWPLSDDSWSLVSKIRGLSPYTLVAPDAMVRVDPAAAREVLGRQLRQASELFPESKNLVFYLGEGGPGSRVRDTSFDDIPDGAIAGGAVLGYGTDAGGPIPQGWIDGNKVYFSDPATNAPANSAIDESRLKQIASDLGVPYLHRAAGQSITPAVPAVESASPESDDDLHGSKFVERRELYWIFSLLASVLVLVEIVLTIREFRRNRMSRMRVQT